MRDHKLAFRWLTCIFLVVVNATPAFSDWIEQPAVLGGFTSASRTGEYPRYGLDLTFMSGPRQGSIKGYGLVIGSARPPDGEFYVGAAFGEFYIISVWLEAAAHFEKSQFNGIRVTAGLGPLIVLPFVSIGFSTEQKRPSAEIGIMIKFPLYLTK